MKNNIVPEGDENSPFSYDTALGRIGTLTLLGAGVIVVYALQKVSTAASVLSLEFMIAGASAAAGGLLGFLFGVPHTRELDPSQPNASDQADGPRNQMAYRPNTSLEQISDWLTKIIVGVGLVQIKSMPGELMRLAKYLASGMTDRPGAESLVATIIVFFAICGFVFGFLWARIYLRRWFKEADQDEVKRIDEKLTQLENDAKALALVTQQVNRSAEHSLASDGDLAAAIGKSSAPVKTQIFDIARKESFNFAAPDYDLRIEGVIAIFKALIAADPRQRFHRNYGELSYAYSRCKPPNLEEAERTITTAIEVRDRLGERGWKYYEFRRGRYRIQRDPNFRQKKPSAPDVKERILQDLQTAFRDKGWETWFNEPGQNSVKEWLTLNAIDEDTLRGPLETR